MIKNNDFPGVMRHFQCEKSIENGSSDLGLGPDSPESL